MEKFIPYLIQVDLLFCHRELQCLVAFERKVGRFKLEYVSKMDFYLEAMDRLVKKSLKIQM